MPPWRLPLGGSLAGRTICQATAVASQSMEAVARMHQTMHVCCGFRGNMRCKRADNDSGMSRAITNARNGCTVLWDEGKWGERSASQRSLCRSIARRLPRFGAGHSPGTEQRQNYIDGGLIAGRSHFTGAPGVAARVCVPVAGRSPPLLVELLLLLLPQRLSLLDPERRECEFRCKACKHSRRVDR